MSMRGEIAGEMLMADTFGYAGRRSLRRYFGPEFDN
jgi:hypothetical protein